mgnify:CR=1 FL=1
MKLILRCNNVTTFSWMSEIGGSGKSYCFNRDSSVAFVNDYNSSCCWSERFLILIEDKTDSRSCWKHEEHPSNWSGWE